MAPAYFPAGALILSLLSLFNISGAVSFLNQLADPNSTFAFRAPATMLLPLMLSPLPHSSRISAAERFRRRLDGRRSSSRLALRDDLEKEGYYSTKLWIGTPPQRFALIVDTGSSLTYVPCSTCELCGKHEDPKFQPQMSSTYQPVKCNTGCTCDNDRKQCIYEREYAELSSSSGVLGKDVVTFGNGSGFAPQRAVFGCETMETGAIYNQNADGIMGLGRGKLSIMDQLVKRGAIGDSFSLCYGGMDFGGGAMVLGEISPPTDMVFTRSDPVRSPYYNIDLKKIHVAGKELPLSPQVFDGKHGTVLDSGTTYAYLPQAAFLAFKAAIMNKLHSLQQIPGADPNYDDICFSGAGSDVTQLSRFFPRVDLVFENGENISLSPENYLFRHLKKQGAYCLGIFQNGNDPTTLLGGIIVRNMLATYDREHEKIGFWKTNCSELWKRLHMSSTSPPSSSSLNQANSTNNTSASESSSSSLSEANSTNNMTSIGAPAEAPHFPSSGQNTSFDISATTILIVFSTFLHILLLYTFDS